MKKDFRDFIGLAVPKYLFEYEGKSYYGMLIAMWEDGRYCMHIGLSKVFWTLEDMPEEFRTPLLLVKAKSPCEEAFPLIDWSEGKAIVEKMELATVAMNGKPVPGSLIYTGLYMVTMPYHEIEPYSKEYGFEE